MFFSVIFCQDNTICSLLIFRKTYTLWRLFCVISVSLLSLNYRIPIILTVDIYNEFGSLYMSTVGYADVYGEIEQ